MRALTDQPTQYADCHRDGRNLATHCIGVPVIVVAIAVLLARPLLLDVGGIALGPALTAVFATTVYGLRLAARCGLRSPIAALEEPRRARARMTDRPAVREQAWCRAFHSPPVAGAAT